MAERLADCNVAVALLANTRAMTSALVALILIFRAISGAHLNPAIVGKRDKYLKGLVSTSRRLRHRQRISKKEFGKDEAAAMRRLFAGMGPAGAANRAGWVVGSIRAQICGRRQVVLMQPWFTASWIPHAMVVILPT